MQRGEQTRSGQSRSRVSNRWSDRKAILSYCTGVSLHSHTSMSEETMLFVHGALRFIPGLKRVFSYYEQKSRASGFELDFVRGHWRPPLVPRMAYEVESTQIADLGLNPLVSLTDHDTIAAPQLLRALPEARGIPVSLEWTVPFGTTEFHIGVHNLPSSEAYWWMQRLRDYTAAPVASELRAILHDLDELPGTLLVLNHPIWNLHKIGTDLHLFELTRFLVDLGQTIHALEVNGLRNASENRAVIQLARETGHLLISGGDRHGTEPSACINLSRARNFREFVEEIRIERQSHVLVLEQYRRPWEQRILQSTLDAVTDFPEFTEGWRRWDDRAFHPDRSGTMRPLSQLWRDTGAPWPLRGAVRMVRLGRSQALSHAFSMAFRGTVDVAGEVELL